MPVLVTAPGGTLGQAVVERLAATGGQIRAFCGPEAPVARFRQLGVVCASGSLLDEGHLETAMEQVHTVVHLAVDPLVGSAARIVEEAAVVVTAAAGARVQRIISRSVPGANHDAGELRRAAAEVEDLIAALPVPSTAIRASLVDTPELRHVLARTPLDREALETAVAPLHPASLADLILWLDDQRDAGGVPHRVLAAEGPRRLPLRDFLGRVGITPMSAVGRFVDRLRPGSGGGLVADTFAGPWVSGRDVDDAWTLTGIEPIGADL